MPPFLGFGRRRCLWITVFVLVFLGLGWNLSRSREEEDDDVEEDFSDEDIATPWKRNESLPSNLYNQFPSPLPPPRARSPLLLQPVPLLPQPCLSEWLTHGTLLGSSCSQAEQPKVDFVWTWLNSSDPLWTRQLDLHRAHQPIPARHYRDHGELQHSLRSAEDALPPSSSSDSTFFVVLSDWEGEKGSGGWVGQRPSWLALSGPVERERGRVVTEVSHSQIFGAAGRARVGRRKWERRMRESLPTFNSFSIESHLHLTPSISPAYVYMNDDFFLLAPHTPSSFHSLPFGPLIPFSFSSPTFKTPSRVRLPSERWAWKIDPGFVGSVPNKGKLGGGDESVALERTNFLIGERFGQRPRPTLLHAPKPLLAPIQHEFNLIWWEKHFSKSTMRRFREDGKTKPGDYHSVWMGEMFLVERAREAMLWTWVVVTMGEEGTKGRWDERERDVLRGLFGLRSIVKALDPNQSTSDRSLLGIFFNGANALSSIKPPIVTINQTTLENRHTLRPENVRKTFEWIGQEPPNGNLPGWTSLDGPPPPLGASSSSCEIDLQNCFGRFWPDNARQSLNEDAAAIFKRVAFEKPECGDCLLSAIIQASGPLGMSNLLPPPFSSFVVDGDSTVEPSSLAEQPQPHLPLTESWKKTDFSLRAVLASGSWGSEVQLRDWCERLIARYIASSIKDSTPLFARLRTPLEFKSTLSLLETLEPTPGMVAMNDDLPEVVMSEGGREEKGEGEETARLLRGWMERRWSRGGGWEI